MNIADYIAHVLARRQATHIFGYPGAAILPLMDAFSRHPDMAWILTRHEGTASLAASAMARLTGKLAVCAATAGPGVSNLATGLLDAQLDRVPLLALTGELPMHRQGRHGFQDVDHVDILRPLVALSVRASHPAQVPMYLRECLGHAEANRVAVHLTIPRDIQLTEIDPTAPQFSLEDMPEPLQLLPAPDDAFQMVTQELSALERVVIAVGPRAREAGAAIEQLAEKFQVPMVYNMEAKGVVRDEHPLVFGVHGVFGLPGLELARQVVAHADAVLAFGLDDLGPFVTDDQGYQVRKLFVCEPDFASVTHRFRRQRTLVGPLTETARQLASRLQTPTHPGFLKQLQSLRNNIGFQVPMAHSDSAGLIHPARFLAHLQTHLDAQTVLALDVGDHTLWALAGLSLNQRQRMLVSNRLGTMGFCLPALIAAQLAHPEQRAVGICGDGGAQMVLGELGTAVQHRLPLILVVFNNGLLQRVVAQQAQAFGTVLHNPSFAGVAQAYGAAGYHILHESDIPTALAQAFAHRHGPFVLEVQCDPQARAPFTSWDAPLLA